MKGRALDDKKADELYRSMIEVAFNEDKAIIDARQRLISHDAGNVLFVNVPFDAPASRRAASSSVP